MSGTKRLRIGQPTRAQLTPALREFLETGDLRVPAARARGEVGKWALALEYSQAEDQRAAWREHGDEVTRGWVSRWPGSRPWGFWKFSATEPRRWVGTSVGLEAFECWRDYVGVARVVQPGEVLQVESEASYLRRVGVLTDAERGRLNADDFEPEVITDDDD